MKKTAKNILHSLGYKIIRHQRAERAIEKVRLKRAELVNLEKDINEFAQANKHTLKQWADFRKIRNYLSNERIASFHLLLNLLKNNGIELSNKSIADFGSGTGYLLRLIVRQFTGVKLTGFDPYAELTEVAKALCPEAVFYPIDVYDPVQQQFDCVFCTEVLEHLTRPDLALKNLLSVLNAGGVLVLTVPNGREDTMQAHRLLGHGKGYIGHINFWSPESWKIFLEMNASDYQIKTGLLCGNNYAIIQK